MNRNLNQIKKAIRKASNIAIFSHINPDPDAMASSLSLKLAIEQMGKKVDVYLQNNFSQSQKEIFDINLISFGQCDKNKYDLMIATDTPSKNRLGDYGDIFTEFPNTIVIDHHKSIDLKPTLSYVDTGKSSCAEISYKLIKKLKIELTKQIASYLYAGLSSDTNSFINSNTNCDSFIAGYKLLKAGANIIEINEKQYKMRTLRETEFTRFLWNNFVLEGDVSYCLVDYKTLKGLNGELIDCDSFSSELLSLEQAKTSFSLVEFEKGLFNLSMRAKHGGDVRSVALALGGGGHLAAAGAVVKAENIEEAKNRVLDLIKKREA